MRFTAPLISALSLYMATTGQADDECKLVTDRSAPVWQYWDQFPTAIDSSIAFLKKQNLDKSLSSCLGSAEVSLLDIAGLFMNKDCKAAVREVMPNFDTSTKDTTLAPLYKELFSRARNLISSTPATLISNFNKQKTWALAQGPQTSNQICANLRNNAVPCIEKAVVPLLFNNVLDNDCCDEFRNEVFRRYTSYQLDKRTLVRAVKDVINIPCTIQAPGFTGVNQTCLHTAVQTLFNGDHLDNVKSAISTKEDSVCQAANGEPFNTYSSSSPKQYPRAAGCCVVPIDKAATIIGSIPFIRKLVPADALVAGKCIVASKLSFVKRLLEQTPGPLKASAKKFVDGLCLHYNVGWTSSCKFTTGNVCDSL